MFTMSSKTSSSIPKESFKRTTKNSNKTPIVPADTDSVKITNKTPVPSYKLESAATSHLKTPIVATKVPNVNERNIQSTLSSDLADWPNLNIIPVLETSAPTRTSANALNAPTFSDRFANRAGSSQGSEFSHELMQHQQQCILLSNP